MELRALMGDWERAGGDRWTMGGRGKQNVGHEGTGEQNRQAQMTSGKCRNVVRRTAQRHHSWKVLGEAAHP
jgi:hypothetical protein